jgi:hypothetical protein
MVIVMYGIVLLIVLAAVTVAATKDARLARAFANTKSQ